MAKNELNSLAVSAFCESMAMMLEAGIQPDEAAALLAAGGPLHAEIPAAG